MSQSPAQPPVSASFSADELPWNDLQSEMKKHFGDTAYRTWLAGISIENLDQEGCLTLCAPNKMTRSWVKTHYADRLLLIFKPHLPPLKRIEITQAENGTTISVSTKATTGTPSQPTNTHSPQTTPARPAANTQSSPNITNGNMILGAPLDPRLTFDQFVVGPPNELAYAAAKRVAESADVGFNPLFLYGGVGLGKTHLMHAIAHAIGNHTPERRVVYMSAEKFMYQFVRALRYKDTMAFKEQFRSVDVLMIDDVQFICGKDSTQEEFFHTFNALIDQNRQIILSADKSPADLDGMEERLKSRMGWGLVVDLHPTTYELRLGILQAKRDENHVPVPDAVLELLAHRIATNVRELEGAFNRVTAHAELVGRPVTIESVHDVLRDMLRSYDRHVTLDDIKKRVAEHFSLRLKDMEGASRSRAIARPRQIAMYLCKELTGKSLPEIGRSFGGRDHTTVMHAVKTINRLSQEDRILREDVEMLHRSLGG